MKYIAPSVVTSTYDTMTPRNIAPCVVTSSYDDTMTPWGDALSVITCCDDTIHHILPQ